MSRVPSIRLSVMLPHRTPGQIVAARECLAWLEDEYSDGTVFGVSDLSVDDLATATSLARLPLTPISHGAWRNPDSGKVEWDSHIVFCVHVARPGAQGEDEEQRRLMLENIEEVMYGFYFETARKRGEQMTYQKLLFVEGWSAEYVVRPGRHDLTRTICPETENKTD